MEDLHPDEDAVNLCAAGIPFFKEPGQCECVDPLSISMWQQCGTTYEGEMLCDIGIHLVYLVLIP